MSVSRACGWLYLCLPPSLSLLAVPWLASLSMLAGTTTRWTTTSKQPQVSHEPKDNMSLTVDIADTVMRLSLHAQPALYSRRRLVLFSSHGVDARGTEPGNIISHRAVPVAALRSLGYTCRRRRDQRRRRACLIRWSPSRTRKICSIAQRPDPCR